MKTISNALLEIIHELFNRVKGQRLKSRGHVTFDRYCENGP